MYLKSRQQAVTTAMASASPKYVEMSFKERVISFMLCHQLTDLILCLQDIVADLPTETKLKLPNEGLLSLGSTILGTSYPHLQNDDGSLDRESVLAYIQDPANLVVSEEIYMRAKTGITPEMFRAIMEKDENYFIDNFDSFFIGVDVGGYKEELDKFKRFISERGALPSEDMDLIWSYVQYTAKLVLDGEASYDRLFGR